MNQVGFDAHTPGNVFHLRDAFAMGEGTDSHRGFYRGPNANDYFCASRFARLNTTSKSIPIAVHIRKSVSNVGFRF